MPEKGKYGPGEVLVPSIESDACTRIYANTLNLYGDYYQAIISSYNTSTDTTFNAILANAVDLVWDPNTDKSYFRVKTSSSIDWPDYISIYQHATQANEARVYEYIGETTVAVVDNTTYTCYVTDGCFLDEMMGGGAYYVMCPATVSTEPGPVEPTGDGYLDYPGLIYYHGRLNSFIDDALSDLLPKSEDGDILYVYAGQVDNYSDLPTDAKAGDVYNVVNADPDNKVKAGDNIAWTGTEWDDLSGYIDTSIYEKYADALADKEELLNQVTGMLDDYVTEESFDETMSEYVKEEDFDLERIDDPDIIALFSGGGSDPEPEPLEPTNGTLAISGNIQLDEDLYINGNVTVSGNITGSGSIYATGAITVDGEMDGSIYPNATISKAHFIVENNTMTISKYYAYTGIFFTLANGKVNITTGTIKGDRNSIFIINCNVDIDAGSGSVVCLNLADTAINTCTIASGAIVTLYNNASYHDALQIGSSCTLTVEENASLYVDGSGASAYGIRLSVSSSTLIVNGYVCYKGGFYNDNNGTITIGENGTFEECP